MTGRMILAAACVGLVVSLAPVTSASATSLQTCSDQYRDAKKQGTLGAMGWDKFRKTRCKGAAAAPMGPKKALMPSGVGFPTRVDRRYEKESPAQARLHTCQDAYRQNKANKTIGDLKWVEKGGGYYSLCNQNLKN